MNKILFLGGGGHFLSVADCIDDSSEIILIDKKEKIGESIGQYKITGSDDEIEKYFKAGIKKAFISIGGNIPLRRKFYYKLKEIGFEFINIIDKSAVVSKNAKLSEGIFIGKNAVVNASCNIHKQAIINTSAIIEHEATVGAFSNISPGAILCGNVSVGESTFVGAGSIVRENISIGENSVIGMGSVVTKDIQSGIVAVGFPCKGVKKNDLHNC